MAHFSSQDKRKLERLWEHLDDHDTGSGGDDEVKLSDLITSHTKLTDIGTNDHKTIDSRITELVAHIADLGNPHQYAPATLEWDFGSVTVPERHADAGSIVQPIIYHTDFGGI